MKPPQVQDHQLTEGQRQHLYYWLFPRLRELRKVARERLEQKAKQGGGQC